MKMGNQFSMAKRLIIIALFGIFPTLSFAQDVLTESSLIKMRHELQAAGEEKDLNKFFALFTPKARITLKMPANKGVGKQVLNLAKFKKMIQYVWSLPAEKESKVSDFEIAIDEDGQSAVMKNLINETIKINGDTINSEATEKFNVILISGKPTIKSLKVNIIKQY
jgi:hypothetical protein